MKVDNNGFINFQGKEDKVQSEKSAGFEQIETQASANGALGNYGRAFVDMSFRGNIQNPEPITPETKELTDEEFEEYKAKLDEKIKNLPDNIQEGLQFWRINKTNIFLVDKILSDNRIYENEKFINDVNTDEMNALADIRAKVELINVLQDENLVDKENIQEKLSDLIMWTTKDNIEPKKDIITILKSEDLLTNQSIQNKIGDILDFANKDNVQAKKDIIETLKDKKLFDNKSVQKVIGSIINAAFPWNINTINKLMDKFNESKLFKNEENMLLFGKMLDGIAEETFNIEVFFKYFNPSDVANFSKIGALRDGDFTIKCNELQNNAGYELIAKKILKSNKNNKAESAKVLLTIKSTNGIITQSRSEINNENVNTRYKNGKRTVILDQTNNGENISSQMEIVNNQYSEPEYIVYTKDSELLKGAYETSIYYLNEYPEDVDIINAIKNGTIESTDTLSGVKKLDDGSIKYSENYNSNGTTVKRNYTLKPDKVSYEYDYDITDEEGNSLLSLKRGFSKNSDNMTTTIINGKEYKAVFDDDKKIIKITTDDMDGINTDEDDNKSFVIDVNSMLENCDKYFYYDKTEFNDIEDVKETFFNFLKNAPSDQLLILGNYGISSINITNGPKIGISRAMDDNNPNSRVLNSGFSLPVIFHELGHGVDFYNIKEGEKSGHISSNKELIDIYNKEMNEFRENYPEEYQEKIKYFSQKGGSGSAIGTPRSTGLSEVVAETNMLLTTYGADTNSLRGQIFMKNFPKTIAKIAEFLGYNG